MVMMMHLRLVSHNIRSCRLRTFALPGLRVDAANSFLGCLSQMFSSPDYFFALPVFFNESFWFFLESGQ